MSELLTLDGVSKTFGSPPDLAQRMAQRLGAPRHPWRVQAVDDVSLSIRRGEVLGVVGESGCGKSTLGRLVAGIHTPTSGSVLWRGDDIAAMARRERLAYRLAVQMIFQDPSSALNARVRVRDAVAEAPLAHGLISRADRAGFVRETLSKVGFDPDMADRYPHQFSGGQRQRIGIARALAVSPELLVCDESVSALDVSIQAQVINLFLDLRAEMDLTYLFISHDLSVIRHISDRVAIMYLGRLVELTDTATLYARPHHPYGRALLAEAPDMTPGKRRFRPLSGEVPSPLAPPSGCHFHPRCPYAQDRCRTERPVLRKVGQGHLSACHFDTTPAPKALVNPSVKAPAVPA